MPADVDLASKYYHGRPASMDELVELIRHRLWREGKSVRYWLRKIREYRDMAWDAAREDDKEFAYVYAFKAAVLIFDKMPKLEDFRTLLDVHQKNNLADHGQQLIELINSLTPQLRQEYDEWREAERLKVEAVEARRAQAAAEAAASALKEASQDTSEAISISIEDPQAALAQSTSPQSPPPEYSGGSMQLEAETEKQRQMRLLAADISRPSTPVSHDTPLSSELLNGPPPSSPIAASRPDLKDNGCSEDSDDDYGESHWANGRLPSYQEVLAEILQEGPTLSATSANGGRDGALTPDRREDNDNGSDYSFQVVEPGAVTPLTPLTPQLNELPLDEKKELQRREEGSGHQAPEPVAASAAQPSPSPSLSRRSSIAKDKKKNLQPRNPDAEQPSSAQPAEGFNLQVLEKALDTVYVQLELFGSSGTSTQLPRDVKKKIANLNQFLY